MKQIAILLILSLCLLTVSCNSSGNTTISSNAESEYASDIPTQPHPDQEENFKGMNILKKFPEFTAGTFVSDKDCGDQAYMKIFLKFPKINFKAI